MSGLRMSQESSARETLRTELERFNTGDRISNEVAEDYDVAGGEPDNGMDF